MRGLKLHSIYVLYYTTMMVVQSTVVIVIVVMYDTVRIIGSKGSHRFYQDLSISSIRSSAPCYPLTIRLALIVLVVKLSLPLCSSDEDGDGCGLSILLHTVSSLCTVVCSVVVCSTVHLLFRSSQVLVLLIIYVIVSTAVGSVVMVSLLLVLSQLSYSSYSLLPKTQGVLVMYVYPLCVSVHLLIHVIHQCSVSSSSRYCQASSPSVQQW